MEDITKRFEIGKIYCSGLTNEYKFECIRRTEKMVWLREIHLNETVKRKPHEYYGAEHADVYDFLTISAENVVE